MKLKSKTALVAWIWFHFIPTTSKKSNQSIRLQSQLANPFKFNNPAIQSFSLNSIADVSNFILTSCWMRIYELNGISASWIACRVGKLNAATCINSFFLGIQFSRQTGTEWKKWINQAALVSVIIAVHTPIVIITDNRYIPALITVLL